MTEVGKLFEASVNANLDVSEPTNAADKELQKLGVDLDKAEKDGSNSYFNVDLSIATLKENGYKRIHTNSNDPTCTAYTNGTWVIVLVACTGGHVTIYKLGQKAKETIDAGKEFDVFNNSLEENLKSPNESTLKESEENKFEVVSVSDEAGLQKLYDSSALTLEGLSVDSIKDFVEWLEDLGAVESYPLKMYTISGRVMNDVYSLTGNNRYPDNLTIVSVVDIDQGKVVMPRFQIGGRWFDDIVDNNARREG